MKMHRTAFTMVELIFVIVIIGILAAVGIPKLSGVSDGAKKTAEIATISAVSTALETAHGEWSINENAFTWGNNQNTQTNPLDTRSGYPVSLSANNQPFGALVKGDSKDFQVQFARDGGNDYNITVYTGIASNPTLGVNFDTKAPNSDIPDKPDRNDFWIYASYVTTTKTCTYGGKIFNSGDFLLIDINGTNPSIYTAVTLECH